MPNAATTETIRVIDLTVADLTAAIRRELLAIIPPPAPPSPTLGIRAAAELLNCSVRTVHRLIVARELPASRISHRGASRVVIARADLEALLARGRI
jgi:excisionase family DNA binding protein